MPPPQPVAAGFAAAAAFGGELPDDLPSPRAETATGEVGLPAPVGMPDPYSAGPKGARPPAPPASAAAAFGGELPDDLPSPRAETATGKGMEDLFADSFSWAGPADSSIDGDSLTEHSVVGTFTEEMMAPAAIGRPPPAAGRGRPQTGPGLGVSLPGDVRIGMQPAPGQTAPMAAAPEMDETPFDEGRSWDVLSMPGAPMPKVLPTQDAYVESAVKIPQMPPVSKTTGATGVSAPGVAPLPPQLLHELGIKHVLIDVTPRTLAVQTVEGFCDPIIERNSPIPIEQSRVFTTSKDNQMQVVIRICQGESRRVDENVVLGEVALSNIRPAPRGEVRIAVTFEIDTDGIVNVNARDIDTGHFAQTKVTVFGGLGEDEVRSMLQRYGRQ